MYICWCACLPAGLRLCDCGVVWCVVWVFWCCELTFHTVRNYTMAITNVKQLNFSIFWLSHITRTHIYKHRTSKHIVLICLFVCLWFVPICSLFSPVLSLSLFPSIICASACDCSEYSNASSRLSSKSERARQRHTERKELLIWASVTNHHTRQSASQPIKRPTNKSSTARAIFSLCLLFTV